MVQFVARSKARAIEVLKADSDARQMNPARGLIPASALELMCDEISRLADPPLGGVLSVYAEGSPGRLSVVIEWIKVTE